MKLLRYGAPGSEKPGMLDAQGRIRDLSSTIGDVAGGALSNQGLARLRAIDPARLPLIEEEVRLGPCVGHIGKMVCIGLNYADHAAETGAEIPKEPVVFLKATSSVSGPNDKVLRPRGATQLDWEVELGVVIGQRASYVAESNAASHIAGYCVINDVSERSFQLERGGLWDKGKGCDTFAPIGPWLVTCEEVADVDNLKMWLDVNGRRYQDGSTRTMIFKPAFLVHYVSQFMSLQPGDVISTGTPPGVGLGQKPPVYLVPGDVMELGIEGLGSQRQTVAQA